ncbi:MAG: MoaD/ThiS family protein [Planctomycetes bacterium]|nr:MoaD/ThiS family protein [Planctomycetota bacterium]
MTYHLQRFFPGLRSVQVPAATVAEVIAALDRGRPGLATYIVDERGALRPHVHIFIGGRRVRDRAALTDPVGAEDEVHVVQALSGG